MTAALARHTAFRALCAIEQRGAYAHLALREALGTTAHSAVDAGLASEIVHGVTVWRRLLDHWIAALAHGHAGHLERAVRTILRMALYQVRFLERIPAYAAVNDAVELTKVHAPKAARLVNGVLRTALRQTDYVAPARTTAQLGELDPADAALRLSYPDWLLTRLTDAYGFAFAVEVLAAMNRSPVRTLRVNRLVTTREAVLAQLTARGVHAEASPMLDEAIRLQGHVPLESLPEVRSGLCTLQGESSMLVAPLLAPRAGEAILDACAAPGGKATHLAEISDDQATITAVDLHAHRVREIAAAAGRLGLSSVKAVAGDAREITGEYDAILLDAPCSGLGTIARKADLKWTATPAKIASLAAVQTELLAAMAKRVKLGGRLLYSTCTLTVEENEVQRERFLAAHPDFVAEPFSLPAAAQSARDPEAGADGQARIWPQDFGGDGFYLALFRRRA